MSPGRPRSAREFRKRNSLLLPSDTFAEHCTDAVGRGEIFFSHPVSRFPDDHLRETAEFVGIVFENGRSRRSAQLSFDPARVAGNAFQDPCSRRRRHWKDSMGAAHLTVSDIYRRSYDLFRAEFPDQQRTSGNIRESVRRSDLMKMDLRYRSSVYAGLRLCNDLVNAFDIPFHLFRNVQMLYPVIDFRHAVMGMGMGMDMMQTRCMFRKRRILCRRLRMFLRHRIRQMPGVCVMIRLLQVTGGDTEDGTPTFSTLVIDGELRERSS